MKQQVRGVEIAYDDVSTGPVVVLLHGYPFNRTLWTGQCAHLKNDYRIIAPDFRGHGESAVTPGPTTMDELAKDVAALLDTLNVSQATIGGLSMGGYVAFAFYRLFPKRVNSLILAATRAQADTDEARQNRAQQADKALREGMEGIVDGLMSKLLSSETVSKRPDVVKKLRTMMASTSAQGAAAALQGMAMRQDQTPMLKQITVPTLILIGNEDAIIPVADAELMRQGIANSQLQVIENAGHVLNLEQPEKFNAAVANFLSEVSGLKSQGANPTEA